MIDENFVKSAVRIRREFLKVSNSLDMYKKRANQVAENLDEIILKLEDIQERAEKKESTSNQLLEEILKVLSEVEEEGKRLETAINPLNKEMEKLAIEEQELWRLIKLKHPNIEDDKIVEFVKNKLISEGLS
jgi:uncharacterized membrane protein YgaE (UPF0421/DUF939 family)